MLSASPHDLSVRLAEQFSRAPAAASAPGSARDRGGASCGPTAFVSYASENRSAATRITEALLQLGFSDVWLDQRKLNGGDDWSYRIEDAIQECDFFVPIMSAEADARREGVYWEEWHLAVERSHRVKDSFLLPVGIDAEPPAEAGYENIPRDATGVFFRKHLIHAPEGELSTTDREGLENLAARFRENGHG